MILLIALLMAASSTAPIDPNTTTSCAREVGATARVARLPELPVEVRDVMIRLPELFGPVADSDAILLQTDAPTLAERDHVQARFVEALLVDDIWFVQHEVALFAGVLTTSFRRHNGVYDFTGLYLQGPACPSIKAAIAGVTTPWIVRP